MSHKQITQCANDHTECDDSTKFVSGLATPSIITASEGGGISGDELFFITSEIITKLP